jgi:hypothetical protein
MTNRREMSVALQLTIRQMAPRIYLVPGGKSRNIRARGEA